MRALLMIALAAWLLATPPCPAQTPASNAAGPCVDVQVGGERVSDIDCINRQLKLRADQAQTQPTLAAPIDASSPSTAVGTANQAAAEQKMGGAFGKSAQPQRPRPPTFVTPLAVPPTAH